MRSSPLTRSPHVLYGTSIAEKYFHRPQHHSPPSSQAQAGPVQEKRVWRAATDSEPAPLAPLPIYFPPCPAGMTLTSTSDPLSIFKGEKPKPGVYKIQNIHSETYLDVEIRSRGLCCRPSKDLDEGRGLVRWYILCYP